MQEHLKVIPLWPCSCSEGRVCSKRETLNQSSPCSGALVALIAIDTTNYVVFIRIFALK